MQIEFTNASGAQLYVSALYSQMEIAATVTTSRTPTQLDDQGLKALLESGDLTVTGATLEDGDSVNVLNLNPELYYWLPIHTDANRPLPTAVKAGTVIWNSDDSFTNVSDGTNWYDPTGVIT